MYRLPEELRRLIVQKVAEGMDRDMEEVYWKVREYESEYDSETIQILYMSFIFLFSLSLSKPDKFAIFFIFFQYSSQYKKYTHLLT